MVRREVRGDVEDRAVRGPSRRSMGHRVRRTPQFCQPIPWTRGFGSSPIRVQEARAGSPTARSTLIWEIPGYFSDLARIQLCFTYALCSAVVILGPETLRYRFGTGITDFLICGRCSV
jgi:hypothetical protein